MSRARRRDDAMFILKRALICRLGNYILYIVANRYSYNKSPVLTQTCYDEGFSRIATGLRAGWRAVGPTTRFLQVL